MVPVIFVLLQNQWGFEWLVPPNWSSLSKLKLSFALFVFGFNLEGPKTWAVASKDTSNGRVVAEGALGLAERGAE